VVDVTQAETFKFCDSAFRNMDLPLIDKDDFEDIRQALQALCKRHREQATAPLEAQITAIEARCDALARALGKIGTTYKGNNARLIHSETQIRDIARAELAKHKGKNDDWSTL
jgi:septal ring factor EnvC (AmiA/AmiB activator)